MNMRGAISALALFLVLGPASALADTFEISDQGIDYTLTVTQTGNTMEAWLSMDTSGAADSESIHAIGLKLFTPPVIAADISVDSVPLGSITDWVLTSGVANANTVDPLGNQVEGGTNGAGWFTLYYNPTTGTMDTGVNIPAGVVSWHFTIDTTGMTSISGPSIKAIFVDPNDGTFSDQFSSGSLAPVPEPTTLLLFGSGLLGGALQLRKRFK